MWMRLLRVFPKKKNTQEILSVFSYYHNNLNFTTAKENNKSYPYLDITIIRTEINKNITVWYLKPTSNHLLKIFKL